MIIGIGHDMIDVRRIERTLERFGERFTLRVFTEIERAKSDRRRNRASSYAKRFAVKEATSKALGTGFSQGVYMRDIGTVNKPSGQPTLALTGGALARLHRLIPPGFVPGLHVTITDDYPWAQSFVMIEAVPEDIAAKSAL